MWSYGKISQIKNQEVKRNNDFLGSDFKKEDYAIPYKYLDHVEGLSYFEGKLFSGYSILKSFKNGKPKEIVKYKNGVESGLVKKINNDKKSNFSKEKKIKIDDLEYINHYAHYNNIIFSGFAYKFDENGNLLLKQEYKKGVRDGKRVVYHSNGQKSKECITLPNGEDKNIKVWYENGEEMDIEVYEEATKKAYEDLIKTLKN